MMANGWKHAAGTAWLTIAIASCGGSDSTGSNGGDAGGDSGFSGGCRSDNECKRGAPTFESCAHVEDPQCGGAAPPQNCSTDTDCADAGADRICLRPICGGAICAPKCKTNADCPSSYPGSLTCDVATGRCGPKACAITADCPTNFLCSTDKVCRIKPCLLDTDCAGACVKGSCSSSVGVCRAPAA
jgi:hypothetical protein